MVHLDRGDDAVLHDVGSCLNILLRIVHTAGPHNIVAAVVDFFIMRCIILKLSFFGLCSIIG